MTKPLSGYRLMWMMVMFDLPVITPEERKTATEFRNLLLDLGFEMSQFSVYTRFVGEREKCVRYIKTIKRGCPDSGNVSIVFFTDRQFEEIISICNRKKIIMHKKPDQLTLF
jgi:CRISPR-associated protein Cas2